MPWLVCLIRGHVWRWYALYDPGELRDNVHLSQCLDCRKIVGGWRGKASV